MVKPKHLLTYLSFLWQTFHLLTPTMFLALHNTVNYRLQLY